MTSLKLNEGVEKLEKELECRLKMIPHGDDRRKYRGIIQRIRTADRKKHEAELSQALREERSRIARDLNDLQVRQVKELPSDEVVCRWSWVAKVIASLTPTDRSVE